MASVVLDRVSKRYGTITALNEVSLAIQDGELLTLLGPSGCGKTTTLRLIAGFLEPSTGSILIGNREVTHDPPHRRGLGMVFQNYALFPHLTVGENIGFGMRERAAPRPAIRKRVGELLDLIRLPGIADRYPAALSGGQQQRVALARAIACEPRVLLMDEPLAALDLKLREAMQTEIRRIQRELQITTIYVTHDQTEAMRISDHIAVMNAGNVAQFGTPRDIYAHPKDQFVANFVGKINLLSGRIVERKSNVLTVDVSGQLIQVLSRENFDLGSRDEFVVGIRPEDMRISAQAPSADGRNVLRATFEGSTFIGSVVEMRARLVGDLVVLVEAHAEAVADLVERDVYVWWPLEKGKALLP